MAKEVSCNFCGLPEPRVAAMIASENKDAFICDKCIEEAHTITGQKIIRSHNLKVLKPKEIELALNDYVIGQPLAKKTIAVSVYNHYKRVRAMAHNPDGAYAKSNVMLLGPTGSGKTLLAKTLARIIDVPFAISDATTLTEAGYVGEDVENILLRLLQNADYDVARAEVGIVYLDEVDKIRRTTANVSITKDVSGEGVQQALLKIVEGTEASLPPKGGRKHPNQDLIKLNTQNILFMVGGAFVGLDDIVAKRLGKATIGFNTGGSVQHNVQDKSWLLSQVETEDLISFGMIPEFVGRFNSIASLNELTEKDLIRILTEPKDSIVRQYQALFKEENVDLQFTDGALHAIGKKAKATGTGARALRQIMENLLLDLMYETPSDPTVRKITIDERCVEEKTEPLIERSA